MNGTSQLPGAVSTAVHCTAEVIEQVELARHTYRLRLRCPEIASQIVPGQFFMLRPPSGSDPLLGRPFALYDIYRENECPAGIDFVYHVIGKLTGEMSGWKAGRQAVIWGPLGNGFPAPEGRHIACVGGGIGYTPFLAVAREILGSQHYGTASREPTAADSRVTLCYGVRSRADRAALTEFDRIGMPERMFYRIATEDGSEGLRGLVTDLLNQLCDEDDPPDRVYTCGPVPMMAAVAHLCRQRDIPCWASLESPMACGFGACFSCVTKVRTADGEWDYLRTCVEGPVFPAESLVWD